MFGFLNRKVSTLTGIVVLVVIAVFCAHIMIREYQKLLEMRFEQIDVELKP